MTHPATGARGLIQINDARGVVSALALDCNDNEYNR